MRAAAGGRRTRRLLVAFVCCLGVALSVGVVPAVAEGYRATVPVLRVVDGDTIDVDLDGDGRVDLPRERIRMAGVSANELAGPGPDDDQCLARAATERLRDLIPVGSRVTLTARSEESTSRGRALRYVSTPDLGDVGRHLIAEGLALAHPQNVEPEQNGAYLRAMREASAARAGMFDPAICAPGPDDGASFRIWADWNPPGLIDTETEWIRIRNTGSVPVVLNDGTAVWSVRDNGQNWWSGWPVGTTLEPGQVLTVRVGSGTDDATTYHWGMERPVFGNLGDGAHLVDPDGDLRASFLFPCGTPFDCKDPLKRSLRVHAFAGEPGDDDPNGEWINVENRGAAPVDLEGYVVEARGGGRYVFDHDATVQPGERVRLYLGRGSEGRLEKRIGKLRATMPEDDGWVRVRRLDGPVVRSFAWPCRPCPVTRDAGFGMIHYNAAGSDVTNPNGEWIELRNDGRKRLDLRDWHILAEPHRFVFHDSLVLPPGGRLMVKIGKGKDSDDQVHWGLDNGILRNLPGGDEVLLLTPYGSVKTCRSWGKRAC